MKIAFLQIFLALLCLTAQAQKVSNIRAEQRGQDIVVFYSFETSSTCEVSLLLSQDNGVTWGSPLKNVSGDVGKNIAAGEKQITWKVLEEREQLVGDKVKFKVIAANERTRKQSFEPEMIFVKGGTFQMGSIDGLDEEKIIHSVTISSFQIGKFEVTQSEWTGMMKKNPSEFIGCENCPVEHVSWNDVQNFIVKLNQKTGKNYRLPTEAEWEYAAKGGDMGSSYLYSGSNDIYDIGWCLDNSSGKTHAIGKKLPNELGIFDMTGNVEEWCSDWYEHGNYSTYSITDPTGALSGRYRVIRGGSFGGKADWCRNSRRFFSYPDNADNWIGFRLALSVE
jgi:formylglycine-generating enzyme required for sulfatase activity